ncbi:hypothetical protein NDU88_001606 [Pleurodeles waltl]|uniref:Uncharacterized protein n=1 Tax=Pleurodeles waltl TaxID=8319 RepID=A0AAV7LY39_PLEWA|nr:hypothetical protein NDU88_001606 [Pleurodeles waltl]
MVVTSGAARGGQKAERADSGWRWCSRRLLVGLIVCGKKIKSDLMQRNRLASFIAATTMRRISNDPLRRCVAFSSGC